MSSVSPQGSWSWPEGPEPEPTARERRLPVALLVAAGVSLLVFLGLCAIIGGSARLVRARRGAEPKPSPASQPADWPAALPGTPRLELRDGQRVVHLAREHAGQEADVRSDCDLDPEEYADLADRALPRLRSWFGPGPAARAKPAHVQVFLCSTVERMLQVERLAGLPSSEVSWRTFPYRGGYYPQAGIAILRVNSPAWMRWNVLHELSHAAFSERVGCEADPLDEGLAEVLPDWLLDKQIRAPEQRMAASVIDEERCGRAVRRGELHGLDWLCSLDYWTFRDEHLDGLCFSCSWALAKLLVEGDDPQRVGKLQPLFDDLARGVKLREALRHEYDDGRLEADWQAEMRGWAEWEPWWGGWELRDGDWRTELSTWDPRLLLAAEKERKRGYDIGFTQLPVDTTHVGIGFVVGMRGEDLETIEFIEPAHEVRFCSRRNGAWREPEKVPLPASCHLAQQSIELGCASDGALELTIGDERMTIAGPEPRRVGGRCGLLAYRQLDAPRRVRTLLAAGAPWLRER